MQTLTVPIGPNASLDGGPFTNFEGVRGDTDAGVLHGNMGGEGAHEATFPLQDVESGVGGEMKQDEPVRVNTGDVGDDYTVGTVEVPLVEGFIVEVFRLPGQGVDRVASLGSLADDADRRRHFERQLARHGGSIT